MIEAANNTCPSISKEIYTLRYGIFILVQLTAFVFACIAISGTTSLNMNTVSAILFGTGGVMIVLQINHEFNTAEENKRLHSWQKTTLYVMAILPYLIAGILGLSGALTTMQQLGWIALGPTLAIHGLYFCYTRILGYSPFQPQPILPPID